MKTVHILRGFEIGYLSGLEKNPLVLYLCRWKRETGTRFGKADRPDVGSRFKRATREIANGTFIHDIVFGFVRKMR